MSVYATEETNEIQIQHYQPPGDQAREIRNEHSRHQETNEIQMSIYATRRSERDSR